VTISSYAQYQERGNLLQGDRCESVPGLVVLQCSQVFCARATEVRDRRPPPSTSSPCPAWFFRFQRPFFWRSKTPIQKRFAPLQLLAFVQLAQKRAPDLQPDALLLPVPQQPPARGRMRKLLRQVLPAPACGGACAFDPKYGCFGPDGRAPVRETPVLIQNRLEYARPERRIRPSSPERNVAVGVTCRGVVRKNLVDITPPFFQADIHDAIRREQPFFLGRNRLGQGSDSSYYYARNEVFA
jgi:hypothetical protein